MTDHQGILNDFTALVRKNNANIGETGRRRVQLGDGSYSGNIIDHASPITGSVNWFVGSDDDSNTIRERGTAILDDKYAAYYDDQPAFDGLYIELAQPPGNPGLTVVYVDKQGEAAQFGTKVPLAKQAQNAAAQPTLKQVSTLKLQPPDSDNPSFTITAGNPNEVFSYPAAITLKETQFIVGSEDISAVQVALASGEHTVVLACLDMATNTIQHLALTAVTAGSDLPAREEFEDVDAFADFDLLNHPSYSPIQVLYLYFDQVGILNNDYIGPEVRTSFPPAGAYLALKDKWDATVDPTITDDSDSGYSIFSRWINTSTPEVFICLDDTVGAAVWASTTAGGGTGMTSFDVAGDTGTPQTIGDGDTLTIEGGTGIDTLAGATKKLTISVNNEDIQDMIASFLTAGANVTLTYSDAGNTLTIAVSGLTATTISDFSEAVDDRVAALLVAGTNINLTYNDGANTLTISVTGLTSSSLSDFAEAVDDRVAVLLTAGTNISLSYNDAGNALTIAITGQIAVANGGTGAATLANHAALIGNGTGAVATLAPGTARNVGISDGTDWTSRALVDADIPDALTVVGGTIDNTPTGATTPAPGTFTTETSDLLKLSAAQSATLSSDAFTISKSYVIVTAETGTADNLATINGGSGKMFAVLQPLATHTITVKNGTGNIFLNSGADFAMSGDKSLWLFYDGTNWADLPALATLTNHAFVVGQGTTAPAFLAPGTSRNFPISDGTDWASRAADIRDVVGLNILFFGDGSDGDYTASSGTTILQRDMYYHDMTPTGTAVLATRGYRVFASGNVDVSNAPAGWFNTSGGVGGNGAATAGGAAGGGSNTAALGGGQSGTVGAVGTTGAGNGTNATATSATSPANGGTGGTSGNGGHAASASVGGSGVASGAAQNALIMRRWATEMLLGISLILGGGGGSGGGGGGGAAGANGGGGGGGGGAGGIGYLSARKITRGASTGAGCFTAAGGNGGNGANAGGANGGDGGGGGGAGAGWLWIAYGELAGSSATNALDASGGAGGNAGNLPGTNLPVATGGDGGVGGRITLINLGAGTITETSGGAGGAHSGRTGGTAGSQKANL